MKKLNQREQIIFFLAVGVIAVYAVAQWVVKPLRENSRDITEQVEAVQKRLKESTRIIEGASALESDYQKLVEIFGKASSEGAETSAMVAQLEAAAKEADIHIANMQPQRAMNKGFFVVFAVDLVIEGPWSGITKFLYIVQAPPDLLNIEEMNLEKYADVSSSLRGRLLLSRLRVDVRRTF